MAEPQSSSIRLPGAQIRGRRDAKGGVAAPAAIFAIASLAAIASDVTTPMGVTITFVGIILVVLIIGLGILSFRSGAGGHEAGVIALVLPLTLCGYAVFNLREGPPGQPRSGVVAQAIPAVERLQATILPVGQDMKTALLLEATLKTGGEAAKAAAVRRVADQKSIPLQKYLYEKATTLGDGAQKQLVVASLLERQGGRSISVELTNEDNLTIYAQYLEGSSIRFGSVDRESLSVRAHLSTNKEMVPIEGRIAGSDLAMTGEASLANRRFPLTMNASLGPDLTFSGSFHFAQGASVPFTIQPL